MTWLDVGVVSDRMVCCTLPERGRERDDRIDSPVEDRREAESKSHRKNKKQGEVERKKGVSIS